eukprot:TRINITY_DN72218_c0_g1_i1.p1 TRINITY_DN72218_c0_g1~~TRINITY_DN72218_c0_g1_i1.p1  ORF type:complete len:250 (-),score=24.82 TRINITY_DN72218_c0_g1_i1:113-862(-)
MLRGRASLLIRRFVGPSRTPSLITLVTRSFSSGCSMDSSSSEDMPFDIRALAQRLRVGERKVEEAISMLQEEGLPSYKEGDHIPKQDADVIAELGLGIPFAPARERDFEHACHDVEGIDSCESQEGVATPADDHEELDSAIASDDIYKILRLLAKPRYGFFVEHGTGSKIRIYAANGNDFVIHQPESKNTLSVKSNSLLGRKRKPFRSFVIANKSPGMLRCTLCKRWFDSYLAEHGPHANERCLGYCGD